MNVNLPQHPPAIRDWLNQASAELKAVGIASSRLDVEIILAHTVRKSRTYLHAHLDEYLSYRQYEIANARMELRLDRTPIAYIIGHKEFYGRRFRVTPATLIPRPESEDMITILKELATQTIPLLQTPSPRLVDVGTGSGCLGITAKLELPELDVTLTDISHHALKVAETNAVQLSTNVTITTSNLLANYPFTADYILANLPYVAIEWERSPETNYEPAEALFANDEGLSLINKLLVEAPTVLNAGGILLLEADTSQHDRIIKTAKNYGFRLQEVRGFIICLKKR